MDARAEAIRQQNAASDIAIADSGMTGIDTAPTYLSAAEEAALADSGMTEIDEGIKEPFFQFGGVNPEPYSAMVVRLIFQGRLPLD